MPVMPPSWLVAVTAEWWVSSAGQSFILFWCQLSSQGKKKTRRRNWVFSLFRTHVGEPTVCFTNKAVTDSVHCGLGMLIYLTNIGHQCCCHQGWQRATMVHLVVTCEVLPASSVHWNFIPRRQMSMFTHVRGKSKPNGTQNMSVTDKHGLYIMCCHSRPLCILPELTCGFSHTVVHTSHHVQSTPSWEQSQCVNQSQCGLCAQWSCHKADPTLYWLCKPWHVSLHLNFLSIV